MSVRVKPTAAIYGSVAICIALAMAACDRAPEWTVAERAQIGAMWLGALGPPPADPTNAVADDPAAATLGTQLFFDPRLSANGRIACVSCHQPDRFLTDGLPVAQGLGAASRNAPSLLGAGYRPWLFWDGRADSLWSQVAGPLEDPREMGQTRTGLARVIAQHYRSEYEALFGRLPAVASLPEAGPAGNEAARAAWQSLSATQRRELTRVLANVGKALAAHERSLLPELSRFDAFAEALLKNDPAGNERLGRDEQRGLRLFLGKAQCARCHQGPLLTDQGFHNTGLAPLPGQPPDPGRVRGVKDVLASELNCAGRFSDAGREGCPHLEFVRRGGFELVGAFKTPGLRNVAETAPYMHDGRFGSLAEVLEHYNRAPAVLKAHGHTDLFPLGLSPQELSELEAFLRALTEVR